MSSLSSNDPSSVTGFIITLVAISSIALSFGNSKLGSFALEIINRWVRWILFSFGFAYFLTYSDSSTRPYWLLVISSFLGWLLIETLYNWFTVSLLSKSDFPLFPKYQLNRDNDEWPNLPRFIKIRETIRNSGFTAIQHLKSYLIEDISIRSSFYENKDKDIRLQVMFVPQRSGGLSSCFIITSVTETGKRIITDNVYLPFGGVYPENWYLDRKPLCRSVTSLLKIHEARIKQVSEKFIPWKEEPLEELNKHQQTLEEVNVEQGLMNPRKWHEEHGKISQEGRYRIWKELWLLNYLGITVDYKRKKA
jgi:hypothetical protein